PLRLRGRGSLLLRGGTATFQLDATAGKHGGVVVFRDVHAGITLHATRLTSVSFDSKHRTATLRGASAHAAHRRGTGFTVVVTVGRHGGFHIKLSNGYTRNGSVHSGSVTIA